MNKILVTGANSFIIYKHPEINRLMESLQIDNRHVREMLNYTQPVSVEEGIRRIVKDK